MALEEAIAFQDLYNYSNNRDIYNIFGGSTSNWGSQFDLVQTEDKLGSLDLLDINEGENFCDLSHFNDSHVEQWGCNSFVELEPKKMKAPHEFASSADQTSTKTLMSCRPKRRRSRSKKNMEDIENQRMTHIAVERNRRKQMNEYLSLLRSLMPESYVQRVDQASIVGGAINYVKELEHKLHLLIGENHKNKNYTNSSSSPFDEFFGYPQYSTNSYSSNEENLESINVVKEDDRWASNENHSSAMADIEVTMVESHANMTIRSKSRPKQLVKLVNELQGLRLSILHLSVTTVDQIVLYSLCVKVEDDCNLNSGTEIATAVNQIFVKIQMEAREAYFSHN